MSETIQQRETEPGNERTSTERAVKTLETGDLFGDLREIRLDHGGTIYRLKITRQNKLILNK